MQDINQWFPEKDEPLRQDVSVLGSLLGDILKEQGGDEWFSQVENARLLSRARRAGDEQAGKQLEAALQGLPPESAAFVVRAFSAYFGLVNMAERVHRIRRRRSYLGSPDSPQPGSFAAVLTDLAAKGVGPDKLAEILSDMQVVPVFTAHPTEASRRTILQKEQRIARAWIERMYPETLVPKEAAARLSQIRNEITLTWQTEEHRDIRPTVADEVEHVLFYLSEVIYRVMPALHDNLLEAVERVYGQAGIAALEKADQPLVRFASWVGGDMDGNPNVNATTILTTLDRHRELILRRYREEVRGLFGHLSQSRRRVAVSAEIDTRIDEYAHTAPGVFRAIPQRYRDMPYRLLLWFVDARLEANLKDAPWAYRSPEELLADLDLIAHSLEQHKGMNAGRSLVLRLRRRVQIFGFHLATLDVRQDAMVHRRVAGELLGHGDFVDRPAQERASILRHALERTVQPLERAAWPEFSHEAQQQLSVMEAVADGQRRFGKRAMGPYIISMAQDVDDALALLYIGHRAGMAQDQGVALDIAPLFETVDDLERCGATLAALVNDSTYMRHLAGRGQRQMVMLGYSDSSKQSGLAASRWALQEAQAKLVRIADAANVKLVLFHGRGGTASRGGSRPRAAVLAEPPGAVRGQLRVTEQGEIIHAKYGLRGIAVRTLELMCGAVIESTALSEQGPPLPESFKDAATALASVSKQHFAQLVFEHPDFERYFREATPIDVVERMRIGSRPPSRRSGHGLENLRAIPWVFSWTQNRHLLTGWYGVGAGLMQLVQDFGLAHAQQMAADWPFFANLLADTEMLLAKSDMRIAAYYAQLAGEVGTRVFPLVLEEFERTKEQVLAILGTKELLAGDPVLMRAIRLRNPYVDPMSLLQVDLLSRWRASGRQDKSLENCLVDTVIGISRGLQNTG